MAWYLVQHEDHFTFTFVILNTTMATLEVGAILKPRNPNIFVLFSLRNVSNCLCVRVCVCARACVYNGKQGQDFRSYVSKRGTFR
jgi:hypothetical protein